jgi:hypothetical protein
MLQQDLLSRSSVTAKLSTWRPQVIPLQENESEAYRKLVCEAVFNYWKFKHRPCSLVEIFGFVTAKVEALRKRDEWPFKAYRGRRTVDRRVNEACSPQFYADNIARIVAVTAGIYQPNPKLFEAKK